MLFEPNRTQFDLNWRMFGIDVRVHPLFWLVTVFLGWPDTRNPNWFPFLLIWVGCAFVSILVHELGHVIAGRIFGADGNIVLYSFGGLAIGSNDLPRRWQRNIVYFAGPLAGFLLLGAVLTTVFILLPSGLPKVTPKTPLGYLAVPLAYMRAAEWNPLLAEAVMDLIEINLLWGLLNLTPIWPLDGGRISKETFEWALPRRGAAIAFVVSGVVAALLAINSLAAMSGRAFIPYVPTGGLYTAILFGLLAVGSYQAYQAESAGRRWDADDSTPWDRRDDDWRRDRDSWDR